MKRTTLLILALLTTMVVSAATASVNGVVETRGSYTYYEYTYFNTEESFDTITGFHVFGMVDSSLVSLGTATTGWDFGVGIDAPTGAADIYWTTDDPATYGLADGGWCTFTFKTPASVAVTYDYVLPGFEIGNWGYDTEKTGGTWAMFGTVPVPMGATVAPEPATILALVSGLLLIPLRKRK